MGINSQRVQRACISYILLISGLCSFSQVFADANGRVGYSGLTGTTCTSCHNAIANIPTVSLTGPASALVAPNSVSSFTFSMSGGPASTAAGFNIAADAGTIMDTNMAGTQMAAGELTHNAPLAMPGGIIAWTFDWQAPATPGTYTIFAAGLSGDNDGSENGDGTAVTTFQIVVVATTTPQPPVAVISGPSTGIAGTSISFSGAGSSDPDGTIVSYDWNFGDGTAGATGANVNHTFAAGAYAVTLTVTDNDGTSSMTSMNIVVTDPGVAQPPIADAAGPYAADAGVMIQFDGSASMDPDGTIVSYEWSFGDGGTATGVNPGYAYTIAGAYTVTLTVTDNDGMMGSATTSAMIADISPAPVPAPLPSAGSGEELYIMHCESCHGPNGMGGPDGSVVGEDAGDIIEAIMEEPGMNYLMDVLRRSDIDKIAMFLDMEEESGDEDDEEDDEDERTVTMGETLYDTFCASCHGVDGNGGKAAAVNGATVKDINAAVEAEPTMRVQVSVLSDDYIGKIVKYLNRNTPAEAGDSGGGGVAYWLGLLLPGIWYIRRRRARSIVRQ